MKECSSRVRTLSLSSGHSSPLRVPRDERYFLTFSGYRPKDPGEKGVLGDMYDDDDPPTSEDRPPVWDR